MTFQELLADSNVSVAVLADTDTLIPPGQVRRSDREKSDGIRPRGQRLPCEDSAEKLGQSPGKVGKSLAIEMFQWSFEASEEKRYQVAAVLLPVIRTFY